MSSKLIAFSVLSLALAACETVHPASGSVDPAFGEAVKYNQAIQTINPDPVYAADAAKPGYHGEKGSEAVKRYRKDQVTEVERTGTTGSSGGPQ